MHFYRLANLYLLSAVFGAATVKSSPIQQSEDATPPLATSFPDPFVDPFYAAPSNIASFAEGQVIRSRRVLTTVTGPFASSSQTFYRTTDRNGSAIGSVATIWTPAVPLSPPRLFSFPQAEDAITLDCAPSWAWVNRSSSLETYYSATSFVIDWALTQGYYVVVADALGPKASWLVGLTEGHATLDGARAAIGFLNLTTSKTQVGILSYSGGAHSAVWASGLAASYAPELNIVGAAFGGTPIDLLATYNTLNNGPEALLAFGAVIGLANGYPQLNSSLQAILNPHGVATVAKILTPNMCLVTQPFADYAGANVSTNFTTSDLLKLPVVPGILAQESLLMNVSSKTVPVPKFPRFEFHGTADMTVPYAPEAEYVQQQCAKGADIRFLTLPGLDHGPALFAGLPGAMLFISQAFSGTLTKVTCGANVTVPSNVLQILNITEAVLSAGVSEVEQAL